MKLRKVLVFNTILGLTLPGEFTNALDLKRGDYLEVYLRNKRAIIIKKHNVKPQRITVDD